MPKEIKQPALKNPTAMGFSDALAYLQMKGHPLTAWAMRKEVQQFPERFGAMRRNPLSKRGRGGRYYFFKENLDKYTSLQETFHRK